MNPRRPLSLLTLLLLTLLLPTLSACDRMNSGPPAVSQGSSSEAEKTEEMEEKADDINRQAEDLKNMEGSDQDKIDAYNKMQQDQQSLADEGNSGN